MVIAVADLSHAIGEALLDEKRELFFRQLLGQKFHQLHPVFFHLLEIQVLLPLKGVEQDLQVEEFQRVPLVGGHQVSDVRSQPFLAVLVGVKMLVVVLQIGRIGVVFEAFEGRFEIGQEFVDHRFVFDGVFEGLHVALVEGAVFHPPEQGWMRRRESRILGAADIPFLHEAVRQAPHDLGFRVTAIGFQRESPLGSFHPDQVDLSFLPQSLDHGRHVLLRFLDLVGVLDVDDDGRIRLS